MTVSINTIYQHTLCFNFNIKNILYIKLIHSCVSTYCTTSQCCIYLIRRNKYCLLLAYINWNYFSFHNIVSRHKFCGIPKKNQILDIFIQCSGETADILNGIAKIGYSINLLHIYYTIICCFGRRDSIAVNGVPPDVLQGIPTSTSYIFSGFRSHASMFVQRIPF